MPQRPDGVRHQAALGERLTLLMSVDRRLRGEPRCIRGEIDAEGDEAEDVHRGSEVAAQRAKPRPRHAVLPPRGHVERQRHQPEEQDEVEPGPLDRNGQAQQHARAEPPPSNPEAGPPRSVGDAALEQDVVHARTHLVAVDDQRAEGRHHEHHQEDVQKRRASRDEADAVGDEQQTGDAADQRGAGDSPDDPRHQHHQDDAADRAGESPAQPAVTEQRLAEGQQFLADGRVHHQAVSGVVLDTVVAKHLPGLRRVVLLVEDRGAAIGGRAEVEEPRQCRQRHDDRRHRPALHAVHRPEVADRREGARADDRDRALSVVYDGRGGHTSDRILFGVTPGRLLLAATPLGQAGDASARLVEALGNADVVAAEDTRRIRTLAQALDVTPTGKVVSFFDQNEAARVPWLVEEIAGGATVLVVSDAGMPLISDPGYRLVAACAAAGLTVSCLPGPSAVTTALAVSGLPSDRFCFEGFAPRKHAARLTWLSTLAAERRTCVFFESPRRLGECLRRCGGPTRRRSAGGGLPRADQDARGGQARHPGRAGRVGRRRRARRDHRRRGGCPAPRRSARRWSRRSSNWWRTAPGSRTPAPR